MDARTENPPLPAGRLALRARLTLLLAPAVGRPRSPWLRRLRGFVSRNRVFVLFAVFLLITDVVLGLFAPVWNRHSPDDYSARVAACARAPRDLVLVGGSPVAEAIDPDHIAGVNWKGKPLASVYALGLSGGTTSDFYHALLRACPTPPRVLVYGITASDLNDSRHEPHGPYSLMTWGDLARWVRLRPESAEWVTRHFVQARIGQASNIFRYRHGVRMWAATEADRQVTGSCPETIREADELRERADLLRTGSGYAPARGFTVGNFTAVKAAGLAPTEFPYLAKFRTGSHLKYLHLLIDWCEERGVELILIDMPVTADLETMHAAAFAEYRERLAEIEQGRGVKMIRATRAATGLSDAHFADLIHMNREGAKLFSDWLRERLSTVSREPKASAAAMRSSRALASSISHDIAKPHVPSRHGPKPDAPHLASRARSPSARG